MSDITLLGIGSMLFVFWFTWNQTMQKNEGLGQTKQSSLKEVWLNIIIGFTVNFIANYALIPLMTGAVLSNSANFWGGWVYTTVSIIRQYTIRRWFNALLHKPS